MLMRSKTETTDLRSLACLLASLVERQGSLCGTGINSNSPGAKKKKKKSCPKGKSCKGVWVINFQFICTLLLYNSVNPPHSL